MGPTKPTIAQVVAPGSIRSLHGLTDTRNSVHGSGESVVINVIIYSALCMETCLTRLCYYFY